MFYMYMHCFFKLLESINLRVNSLVFTCKIENTKIVTCTYYLSSVIV